MIKFFEKTFDLMFVNCTEIVCSQLANHTRKQWAHLRDRRHFCVIFFYNSSLFVFFSSAIDCVCVWIYFFVCVIQLMMKLP